MVHLIAVIGSSPGVGKSTVCRELCRLLGETGHQVDHFEEEHILQRPEFARVAADFYRTGFVAPEVFFADSVAYVKTLLDGLWDVAVTDALWSQRQGLDRRARRGRL